MIVEQYFNISGIKVPIEQKRFKNRDVHTVSCPICRHTLEVEETKYNTGDVIEIVRQRTILHIREAHNIQRIA